MTDLRGVWSRIGPVEALTLTAFGMALVLVANGTLDPIALILVPVLGIGAWMARGMVQQAGRFRPVEPPRTWTITLAANLLLMALGIGAFAWYLAGGGVLAWIPFLIFIAGFVALRQWRRDAVARLYAWRGPALTLLQQGDYRRLIRELEPEALAGDGHPDKLAMVALAYIELNKFDTADDRLAQAQRLAPDFASVNGALGALRRHQARYGEAVSAIRAALRFEDNINSRYYLGLCLYLDGEHERAARTLRGIIDSPALIRRGQVYSAFILGQIAEAAGDTAAARDWYARMADGAPQVLDGLDEEARRHKQTPYGDALRAHVKQMRHLIAQRPLTEQRPFAQPTDQQ